MADAQLYASASGLQRLAVSCVLDALGPRLCWSPPSSAGPAAPVLDVGCGAGDATLLELLPRLPAGTALVAVDSSQDMLRKAASRTDHSSVSFRQLDIATPQLRNSAVWAMGPYSKVFSFFCLHWVQDQRQALRNICSLLVPGGDAVLVLVAGCPLFHLYEQFSRRPWWAPYMRDYKKFVSPYHNQEDPDQLLRTLLTESGLKVKSCQLDKDFAFSSLDQQEIIDSLKAVVPFASRIPPAERESFFGELVEACYANGTLSVGRQGEQGADLHRWNFGLLVAHATSSRDPTHHHGDWSSGTV